MSILAFLVARHCALYWFIVFHYSFFAQLANKLIDWLKKLIDYCFVTNPKNLAAIFLYHILITTNMQSK